MTEQKVSPIICLQSELKKFSKHRLNSYVEDYHEYKNIWKSNTGDVLKVKSES